MLHATLSPAPRKARKPASRRLTFIPITRGVGRLIIAAGKVLAGYWLHEIGSDIGGRGFVLEKFAGETYHVHVTGPAAAMCDCRGHEAHGHCKHADAVLTLIRLGHLPPQRPMSPAGFAALQAA